MQVSEEKKNEGDKKTRVIAIRHAWRVKKKEGDFEKPKNMF